MFPLISRGQHSSSLCEVFLCPWENQEKTKWKNSVQLRELFVSSIALGWIGTGLNAYFWTWASLRSVCTFREELHELCPGGYQDLNSTCGQGLFWRPLCGRPMAWLLTGDQCSGILCGLDQDTACLFFLIFTLGLGSGSLFDSSDVLCTPPLLACLDSPVFLNISEVIRR